MDYGHGDEVTDISAHGDVTLTKALEVSCNCYFGKLTEKLGPGLMEKYVEKTGLNKSYDIDGIDTKAGTFDYPDSGVNLAWTGIGQYHDMVNPCSMMVYMGAIAGNGTAVLPTIMSPANFIEENIDKAKTAILKTEDMIDESTADSLRDMMRNNVKSNYGDANYPGLELHAKSGTAEVGSGRAPHSWFCGFSGDYAFVVCVENGGYGAYVAGPVANRVLQQITK